VTGGLVVELLELEGKALPQGRRMSGGRAGARKRSATKRKGSKLRKKAPRRRG